MTKGSNCLRFVATFAFVTGSAFLYADSISKTHTGNSNSVMDVVSSDESVLLSPSDELQKYFSFDDAGNLLRSKN